MRRPSSLLPTSPLLPGAVGLAGLLVIVAAIWADGPLVPTSHAQSSTARAERSAAAQHDQYRDLRARLEKDLTALASECDTRGTPDGAAAVRARLAPPASAELRLSRLPRQVQPEPPADLPPEERFWKTQLRHLTQTYARQLYVLARQALAAGNIGFAWQLIQETAEYDSDHAPARKVLGYVRQGMEWVSPFEAQMIRSKRVWDDRFGWLPREHLTRYEKGERRFGGNWISAQKEAELRRDFAKGWDVRTDHFRVQTNHSLERGVEIARKLEDFHTLFFQVLAGFFTTQEQARQLVEGSSKPPQVPEPFDVFYFRTRDEYVAYLKTKTDQPVEITNGMYFPSTRVAYFFDDPTAADPDATLYHEATHQILSGARPRAEQIGVTANFWLVEGIACYMESFRREGEGEDTRFSVGRPNHKRLVAARANLLEENYFLPLDELAALGMNEFQRHPQIRKNYSESAAFTHFFLHYDSGRYREALVEQLSQIYSHKPLVPRRLADLVGVPAIDLDRQYRDYMAELDTSTP
jgi:hypothetical protein